MLRSGEQIELALGGERAVVTSVGATLRAYSVDGRAVIDGFDADEVCPGGRGQLLVPWPNRVADGRYRYRERDYRLPIDEHALGHAIHGLVRWAEWRVEQHEREVARLRHRLAARAGYPFTLELGVEYRLSPSGLSVTMGATNVGSTPAPFGMGAHPYFAFAGAPADAVELCVGAQDWLEVDERSIPRRRRPVEGSAVDFARPRRIGAARLDHAFTRLARDRDGLAHVIARHGPDELTIWLDRAFDFVQLFTGDTLADIARRRLGLAIEPATCAPNAFNSSDGLIVLAPGESIRGAWGVVARRR
jgi:aldose 1-epimerase